MKEAIKARLSLTSAAELAQIMGFRDLRKRGDTVRGTCPLHDGDGDGFVIYPGDSGPKYSCHSHCGSGDALDLIAVANHLEGDFKRTLEVAAGLLGVSSDDSGGLSPQELDRIEKERTERRRLREERDEKHRAVFNSFVEAAPLGDECLFYLKRRGCWLREEQFLPASEMGIGTFWDDTFERVRAEHSDDLVLDALGSGDPKSIQSGERDFRRHPLILPVTDSSGRVVGIQARSIDPNCEKRFRYTGRGNSSGGFFGGRDLSRFSDRLVVLAEGAIDALSLRVHHAELSKTWGRLVAIGRPGAGGGLSKEQAEQLRGRRVLIVYDGDDAGSEGRDKAVALLHEHGAGEVSRLDLPNGADVNQLIGGLS